LLLIPTGSLSPNDIGGLKNPALAVFMAKMLSLSDSLKSLLEIGVSGYFSFN
jgi:hypothetical protein